MARDYARFNVAIWSDEDFRALPASAQHLYVMLWTHVTLSYCGVADWRPARLAALAQGLTIAHIEETAAVLEQNDFLIIDRATEEVLVRSWVKHDGLMRQPRLAVSFARAYQAVTSKMLQRAVVREAVKLQMLEPDLPAWAKPEVLAVLESVSSKQADVSSKRETVEANENVLLPSTFSPLPTTNNSLPSPAHESTAAKEPPGFEEFMAAYPSSSSKGTARTAWVKAVRKADPTEIIAGAERFRDDPNREQKFTPYPAKWLNGEQWGDRPLPDRKSTTGPVDRQGDLLRAEMAAALAFDNAQDRREITV